MGHPQVSMGFSTVVWSFMTWMIGGYPAFTRPPRGIGIPVIPQCFKTRAPTADPPLPQEPDGSMGSIVRRGLPRAPEEFFQCHGLWLCT